MSNPMRNIRIEKVTVNIGAGQPGEALDHAKTLLHDLTGKKVLETKAKRRNPTFKLRKGLPIGAKVTLRGKEAEEFLKKALAAKKNTIKYSNFDNLGNFSFGIAEYIDFPGIKYNPDIGMLGFDVCVTLARPGTRVKKRRVKKSRVSKKHLLSKDDAVEFIKNKFGVEVVM